MQKPEFLQEASVCNEGSHMLDARTMPATPCSVDELDDAMAPFFPAARGERSPYDETVIDAYSAKKAQSVAQPQIVRPHHARQTRKYSGELGSVGGVLALIAFFLPWFILQSSYGGAVIVTPSDNSSLLPFLYLIGSFSCISLSIMTFTSKNVKVEYAVKLAYFFSSLWGLITVLLLSIVQSGTIKAFLSGFWIAATGFLLALLGGIITFFEK